jgi:hypothetical protein
MCGLFEEFRQVQDAMCNKVFPTNRGQYNNPYLGEENPL